MSESESVLKAGDVVKLKSGGPKMTVASVEGDRAVVWWFVETGALCVVASVQDDEPRESTLYLAKPESCEFPVATLDVVDAGQE